MCLAKNCTLQEAASWLNEKRLTRKSCLSGPSCWETFLIIFISSGSLSFRALFISIFRPFPKNMFKAKFYVMSSNLFLTHNPVPHLTRVILPRDKGERMKRRCGLCVPVNLNKGGVAYVSLNLSKEDVACVSVNFTTGGVACVCKF